MKKQKIFLAILFYAGAATANPVLNPGIAPINATVSQTSSTTTINQSAQAAVLEWNSFNIGTNEATRFIQPSATAIAVNRINGNNGASQILGVLQANGQVWLLNPAGIFFSKTARVDVAGLLASTSNIRNEDFFAGNYKFSPFTNYVGTPGAIVNQGTINVTDAGMVAFVAPGVANSGTITANLGKVTLAAGTTYTVDLYGDQLINFGTAPVTSKAVDANGNTLNDAVSNSGTIIADGGKVMLQAQVAKNVVDNVINTSGVIQAHSAVQHNGEIILAGGDAGNVSVSGTLDASAVHHGNGGKVSVKSNQKTNFTGKIISRGGAQDGNGGDVEVSGPQLAFAGQVDLSAPHGTTGNLLLDPVNLTIGTAPAANVSFAAVFDGNNTQTNVYAPSTSTSDSFLDINTLTQSLGFANVMVQTTAGAGSGQGDITVAAPISWSSANTLTLSALRNIMVNASISNNGGGSAVLQADNAGSGVGTVAFSNGANVSLSGGIGSVNIYYNPVTFGVPQTFYSGGTAPNGYMLINTAAQLQSVGNFLSGNFALGKDVDASSIANFTPIGALPNDFTGKFDGQNHVIRNLTIHNTSDSQVDLGLFGVIADAQIKNLGLVNANVSSTNLTQTSRVGSLVGLISNTTSTILNVSNAYSSGGSVSATGQAAVGGLIGVAQGANISNVYSTNSVSGGNSTTTEFVGGLIGESVPGLAVTSLSNSSSFSTVTGMGANAQVGGLIGADAGGFTVTNSFSTGRVSAPDGGIAGGLIGTLGLFTPATVMNTYSTGAVSGGTAGGLLGEISGSGSVLQNSYSTGAVTGTAALGTGGLIGTILNVDTPPTLSHNFWDATTSGRANGVGNIPTPASVPGQYDAGCFAGGACGFNLSNPTTFSNAGWSITTPTSTWNIINARSYPYFNWKYKDVAITAFNSIGSPDTAPVLNPGVSVSLAAGGSLLANATVVPSTTTDGSGVYHFLLDKKFVSNTTPVFIYYPTIFGTLGNTAALFDPNPSIPATATLFKNTVQVQSFYVPFLSAQSSDIGILSNSILGNIAQTLFPGNPTFSPLLFSSSGPNNANLITGKLGFEKVYFVATEGTPYLINGTLMSVPISSGGQGDYRFGGDVKISGSNVTTAGNLIFMGSVSLTGDTTLSAPNTGSLLGSIIGRGPINLATNLTLQAGNGFGLQPTTNSFFGGTLIPASAMGTLLINGTGLANTLNLLLDATHAPLAGNINVNYVGGPDNQDALNLSIPTSPVVNTRNADHTSGFITLGGVTIVTYSGLLTNLPPAPPPPPPASRTTTNLNPAILLPPDLNNSPYSLSGTGQLRSKDPTSSLVYPAALGTTPSPSAVLPPASNPATNTSVINTPPVATAVLPVRSANSITLYVPGQ